VSDGGALDLFADRLRLVDSFLPSADGPFAPWRSKLPALHFGQVFTALFLFTLFSTLCFEESSPLFFDSSLVSAMIFDSLCLSRLLLRLRLTDCLRLERLARFLECPVLRLIAA